MMFGDGRYRTQTQNSQGWIYGVSSKGLEV